MPRPAACRGSVYSRCRQVLTGMDLGVLKIMLFFGPLLALFVWQYLSVSRTLDADDAADDKTDDNR